MRILPLTLLITLTSLNLFPLPVSAEKNFSSVPLNKESLELPQYREGEIIVKYKSEEKKEKAIREIEEKKSLDLSIKERVDNLNIAVVSSETKTTEELLKKYEDNPDIEYSEPNYIKNPTFTPNDTSFYFQWAHDVDPDIDFGDEDTDIDSTDAWDIEQNTAAETIVAVIDSGIDYSFSDLSANMWDGSGSCFSDTGASISCPNHGWDYEDSDNDPNDTVHSRDGYQGHGTHVASVISAETDSASGIAGISRYNNVKVMALRFGLDTFSEIQAINFAINNNAKVINASFAGNTYSQAEKDAIDSFPGIFVAAAGNGGDDNIGDNNDLAPLYPCNYESANVICVGATTENGEYADFSNYGNSVDIAAPGEDILGIQQGGYYTGSGTSFAAPFVAGTAALLYSHQTSATISEIRDTVLKSSEHKTYLYSKTFCSRRLNLNNALTNLINTHIPSENCENYNKPVYRFWSPLNRAHFYTASEGERDNVIAKYSDNEWRYEGIAYYVPN